MASRRPLFCETQPVLMHTLVYRTLAVPTMSVVDGNGKRYLKYLPRPGTPASPIPPPKRRCFGLGCTLADDLPGLAHFCEHLLFLGTDKYPDETR